MEYGMGGNPRWITLHSNMFLFKRLQDIQKCYKKYLYIPICFYLNKNTTPKERQIIFTLHSNMTSLPTLHSNMFLFKRYDVSVLAAAFNTLHSNMFLFKRIIYVSEKFEKSLYIPICFYLNSSTLKEDSK